MWNRLASRRWGGQNGMVTFQFRILIFFFLTQNLMHIFWNFWPCCKSMIPGMSSSRSLHKLELKEKTGTGPSFIILFFYHFIITYWEMGRQSWSQTVNKKGLEALRPDSFLDQLNRQNRRTVSKEAKWRDNSTENGGERKGKGERQLHPIIIFPSWQVRFHVIR